MKLFNNSNKIKLIIAISTAIASIVTLIVALNVNRTGVYVYNIGQNADYKVYVQPNEFIDAEYIQKDKTYISDMVKYISVNFNYNFSATTMKDLNYKYDIIATIYIDHSNNNQNLLTKHYNIVRDKYFDTENKNTINVTEALNIDYNFYNNEVSKFKEKYNLPIKAYLKIDFIVNTEINLAENKSIKDEKITREAATELTIDLNQAVFEIAEQYYGSHSSEIMNTGEEVRSINKVLLFISITLLLIGITYFIIQINEGLLTKENSYKRHLKNLLKKYADVVVEIEKEFNIEDYIIVDVVKFEELIDVEEEVRQPILFYMKAEFEAVFVIVDNKMAYKYVFKL